MAILTWCLYLIVTLLIVFPFVLVTWACAVDLYYKNKEQHASRMLGLFAKGLGEYGKELRKMGATVKKEKEE